MMISTKGRYALRVMVDLSENTSDHYIPLKNIAERQEISEKYLENIISILVKSGFVEGVRGKGGGYKLTRSPEEYTVGSVLKITEGSLSPVSCLDFEHSKSKCFRTDKCKTLQVWKKLDDITQDYLEGITVADIAFSDRDNFDYVI